MRRDHDHLSARGAVVIAIGPDSAAKFQNYWLKKKLPFIGLPDEKHSVLKLYGQQVKLFKLGRQPAQMVVDREGILRYVHYGHSMSDIPAGEEMLSILDDLATNRRLH